MVRQATTAFAGASALLNRSTRDQLRLSWRLLRDERVSGLKFALPAILALYLASPVDLIPDFLVGLGQMDDLGIVVMCVLLIGKVIPRLAPERVAAEHLRAMGLDSEKTAAADAGDIIEARYNVRGS